MSKEAEKQQKELFSDTEIEKMSFEQAIDALTEIVEKIESGDIELEESLKQYETGMAMIKRCRGILLDAEKRIKKLSDDEKS